MIDNRELRIGNWVEHEGKFYQIVSLWLEDAQMQPYKARITNRSRMGIALRELSPIPLTPEILKKAGFEKDKDGDYIKLLSSPHHWFKIITGKEGWMYPLYVQCPETSIEDYSMVGLKRVNSVHMLQNLYFCLTGEELEIDFM